MLRVALVCSIVALTGCTSFERPLGGTTEVDVHLVGRWEGHAPERGEVRLTIGQDGGVDLTSTDPESGTEKDHLRLSTARVAGIDVANVAIETDGKTAWQPLRYQMSGRDELRLFLCNDETWYEAVKHGEIAGNASRGPEGPSTWVTAADDKLLEFVRTHRDAVFVGEPIVLHRMR